MSKEELARAYAEDNCAEALHDCAIPAYLSGYAACEGRNKQQMRAAFESGFRMGEERGKNPHYPGLDATMAEYDRQTGPAAPVGREGAES